MTGSLEEISRKIDALGLWEKVWSCVFALRPAGTVLPYFCAFSKGDGHVVRARLLLLEGWQTFHDFMRLQHDRESGFVSSTIELPQFVLVVLATGETKVFRHDAGFVPREVDAAQAELCRRLLWEAYGVMLRIESDPGTPMAYAAEQAMFSRVEGPSGTWRDAPFALVQPKVHVERVSIAKAVLAKAKDLPFASGEAVEVDFRLTPGVVTREKRPRCAYQFVMLAADTGAVLFSSRASVDPESGLRGIWEPSAMRLLDAFVKFGKVPGEVRLVSGRLFRLLRPLGEELPFKLSLHEALPHVAKFFNAPK